MDLTGIGRFNEAIDEALAASMDRFSARVDAYPSEKRTDDNARSRGMPIASRTCDGSIAPELHAEPDAAMIPC